MNSFLLAGRGFVFAAVLMLSACASRGKQSEAFLKTAPKIPESTQVQALPFYAQTKHYCGPASLAMVMKWAGHEVSMNDLATQIYTPGKKGSLQGDIMGSTRRHGLLAVPVTSMAALLTEIAAGNPVLVLQNLGLSWFPRWHYAVAMGYDLKNRKIILHSGRDAFDQWRLRIFEDTWALADFWGIVVLPTKRLSATADDLQHASAAAGLEEIGKLREAEEVYRNILKKWPSSLSALIGIANTRFIAKDFAASLRYLIKATREYPQSATAWHNLAIVQNAALKTKTARISAARAIEAAAPEQKEIYRMNLREIFAR